MNAGAHNTRSTRICGDFASGDSGRMISPTCQITTRVRSIPPRVSTRRGQITVVLLMVMILIIIFSVMFFIQSSGREAKSQQQRTAVQLSQDKLDPLNEYITSCLDIAAKAGLTEMGRQGGYLYVSQGGLVPDFGELDFGAKYLAYEDRKAAYAVLPPLGSLGDWIAEPPLYPWRTFPEMHNLSALLPDTVGQGEPDQSNATGNLTGEEEDPSKFTLLDSLVLKGYFGRNILPNLQKPDTQSLQEQLEVFVANNAAKCLDLENFETQALTIERGTPKVNVTLAENQVVFDLDYPMRVVENRTGAEGDMRKFAVRYAVRLKKIIAFMEQVTNQDVADIAFNTSNASAGPITAWVEDGVSEGDDVVFIRDPESKIIGQPYTFLYARKNRPPALGLINSTYNRATFDIHKFVLCGVFSGGKLIGPILRIEGSTLVLENQHSDCRYPTTRIPLQFFDPDEDTLEAVIVVNKVEYTEYQLKEREVGVMFPFSIRLKDSGLADTEFMAMKTEVVTPR